MDQALRAGETLFQMALRLQPRPEAKGRRGGTTIRAKFQPARAVMARAAPAGPGQLSAPRRGARAERLARQLALAHLIERKIEAGVVRSYGEVGRALGLTQPRITQVVGLLSLSPAIQERILLGESTLGIRAAMQVVREVQWERQSMEARSF